MSTNRLASVWACGVLIACVTGGGAGCSTSSTSSDPPAPPERTATTRATLSSFVQNVDCAGSGCAPQNVIPYTSPQAAGDTNIVVVDWCDINNPLSSVTSVTDSVGNQYHLAVGPTVQTTWCAQSIYYASNIAAAAANANSVTVVLSSSATPEIRILEYSGIDSSNPIDSSTGAVGADYTATTGPITTSKPNDLLFIADVFDGCKIGPTSGYVDEDPTGCDMVEDQIASAAGSYSASVAIGYTSDAGNWVQQMVAFAPAAAGQPTFVQYSRSPALILSSVALTLPSPQTAGDLNLVAVQWSSPTTSVTSITDSAGNQYVLAAGPTGDSDAGMQALYYAKNIADANANTVSVNFSAPDEPLVRILEYSGLDPTAPLDTAASSTGYGDTATTGPLTTSQTNELIVVVNALGQCLVSPSDGFATRDTAACDLVEDEVAASPGSYGASVSQGTPGTWIQQMVAFKPAGGTTTCTASDPCHVAGTWDPNAGACTNPNAPDGTACNDGNACTQVDACQSGTCTGSNPVTCTASDQCHAAGTCNPASGACSNPVAANGTTCNDGNACTQTDTCQSGTCMGGNPVTCTASNACHVAGTCDPTNGACSNPAAPDGAACTGSSACFQTYACSGGTCTGSSPVMCAASDQCHVAGTCDPSTGSCSNPAAANGTACSDGNACTQTDACQGGTCTGSSAVTCAAQDSCHVAGTCDPTSGVCSNPTAPDGTACSGNNACDRTFACASGVCTGSSPVVCAASDQCHVVGTCNPSSGTCSNPVAANGTSCNDNNPCTQNDVCTSGTCAGSAVTCTPQDVCHTAGTCDPTTGQCTTPVIANCDPAPTKGDNPFETRASIIGHVQTFAGAAVTGYTLTVFDVPVGQTPRSDVQTAEAADGSFWTRLTQFPDSEPPRTPPHHLMVYIDAPGFLRIRREVYAHPGTAVDLGVILAAARDPNTVVVGASGGSVTDSKGLITVQIPPGALSSPTPITVTPVVNRDELSAPLPHNSATGYGFELEPSGTQFAVPVTVRLSNWRGIPTSTSMPAGTYDDTNGGWKHVAMASWNGSAWTFSAPHFSTWDVNPNSFGEWVLVASNGQDPNGGATVCGGSAIGVSGGTLVQNIALPTYRHSGRDYGITLNYNSGLAGSRSLATGTPTQTQGQAVPSTGVAVAIRSSSFQRFCVPQDRAAALVAASPGSCGGGSCGLMSVTGWSLNSSMFGSSSQVNATPTANATAIDFGTWVDLPLLPDGTIPASSFYSQHFQAGVGQTGGGQSACLTGGAFASGNINGPLQPANVGTGPLVDIQQQVFVHHRHSSPLGPGWAVADVTRLYPEPHADHVVLVGGDGSEEDFRPRTSVKDLLPNIGNVSYAFALDPSTGEQMMADAMGNIVRLNADGTTTSIFSGLTFSGQPQSMTITYVAGERRFLVALTTQLVEVRPGPSLTVLYTRSGNSPETYLPSQVAARNDLAIYTEGLSSKSVVYRIRLSSPPGAPETISFAQATGGDIGLDPAAGETLGNYAFYSPAGLAYGLAGELYVADTPRSAVYRVAPDSNGEISSASAIVRVVGDGAGRYVPQVGTPFNGIDLPINQPFYLSTSPDGTLLMATSYGVAAYDPVSTEAEWISETTPGSDLRFTIVNALHTDSSTPFSNLAATGPRSYLVAAMQSGVYPSLLDASQLASERDPTRTVVLTPTGATLTDTTQGLVDSFDAQGRLVQRNLRTGEPVVAVSYADTVSDRVSSILDPDGNATAFSYDSDGRLSTITDPANRITTLGHDSFGDLRTITQPDGEVISFVYQAHHMSSKTAREIDTTTYAYHSDGTLQSATKPAGETTTLGVASLGQPPQYASSGVPTYSGTYTDARGVQHNFVTDAKGQIQTDTYMADGVTYTRALAYAQGATGSGLYPLANEVFARNNTLLRVGFTTLNGVQLDLGRDYDTLGRLIAASRSSGKSSGHTVASYGYDSNGFLSSIFSGPSNVFQSITRDNAGHARRVVDIDSFNTPTGRETDFTWTRGDAQPSTIVKHGVTYTLSYDDAQGAVLPTRNLKSVTDTLGRSTSFGYDQFGNIAVASDGATTSSFAFDANNRLIVAADALSNQTTFGYTQVSCGCTEADEVSTIHTPDLAAGKKWTLGYGAEGRLASVTDPDNFIEAYGYEPTGELNFVSDRDGNATSLTHDHLGRVLTIVDALDRTHARSYSVPGQGSWNGPSLSSGSAGASPASTDFTQALNNGDYQIGQNLYQTIGYPAQVAFYRDATFQLGYAMRWDDAARSTEVADRVGTPISSTSVTFGQSAFVDIQSSYNINTSAALSTGFSWPKPGGFDSVAFSYNAEFDVTGTTPQGGGNHTAYTYDQDTGGRTTAIHRTVPFVFPGGPFIRGPDRTFSYYANGKLQTYTGPDGTKTYGYDARGLVKTLSVNLPNSSTENWSFDYDSMGRSFHVTYPDGHVREQLYDPEGRIRSRCYQYSSASFCYTAAYDAAGNPTVLTDPYGGSETYKYDALNRLQSVTRTVNATTEHVETYSFNAIGAVKTTFDPAAMTEVTLDDQRPRISGSGTADAAVPNTLSGQPVTLDAAGRVTNLQGVAFTYNESSEITGTQFTSGTTTTQEAYDYDAYRRRAGRQHVVTTSAGSTTTYEFYIDDGANVVATLDAGNNLKDAYLFEGVDLPLRLSRNGQSYFYEMDLAGNVRRLRNSSGADLGGYRYTAFGNAFAADGTTPAAAIDQPLRWKGRWFEESIAGGVYDMRARWWSPQMGVFLSVDEYPYHDANSMLWGFPGQNPIRYTDPSGHWANVSQTGNSVRN